MNNIKDWLKFLNFDFSNDPDDYRNIVDNKFKNFIKDYHPEPNYEKALENLKIALAYELVLSEDSNKRKTLLQKFGILNIF